MRIVVAFRRSFVNLKTNNVLKIVFEQPAKCNGMDFQGELPLILHLIGGVNRVRILGNKLSEAVSRSTPSESESADSDPC